MVDLKKISDPKGNLTPIEGSIDIPFQIRRVIHVHIPGGETRGGHAHRRSRSLVAASGQLLGHAVRCKDRETFFLSRSYTGFSFPDGLARTDRLLIGFGLSVLASDRFDESEYIRDFDEFTSLVPK